MAKAKRRSHRELRVLTERDRCSRVVCQGRRKRGPKKYSALPAIVAFAVSLGDRHPRVRR